MRECARVCDCVCVHACANINHPHSLCTGLVKEADNLQEFLGLEREDIESIGKDLGLNTAKRRKLIRAWEKRTHDPNPNSKHGKEIAVLNSEIQKLRLQLQASAAGGGGAAKPVWVKTGPD